MKNTIISFFLLLCSGLAISQSLIGESDLQRYWHYRYRLQNDFILIGQGMGNSIPAGERNLFEQNILNWGDATMGLGYYIGILATEYLLLNQNGLETRRTKAELFFAMKAYERLDLSAETYYGVLAGGAGSASLNGFFIRDDVPSNFVQNNYSHFNQGKTSAYEVFRTQSDFAGSDPCNKEMSKDQAINLLLGFALVNKCFTEYDHYNGYYFKAMARQYSGLIVNHIKGSGNWQIKNPSTGQNVKRGSDALDLSFGFACAACKISGKRRLCNEFHNSYSMASFGNWKSYLNSIPPVYCQDFRPCQEIYKVLMLAAIGNSALSGNTTFFINRMTQAMYNAEKQDLEIIPLLYAFLYDKNIDVKKTDYSTLINTASCEGPYNFSYPVKSSSYEWSGGHRFIHPERRGKEAVFPGEQPGLDYMLFFNLLYLIQQRDQEIHSYAIYLDSELSGHLPYFQYQAFTVSEYGSIGNPAQINVFRSAIINTNISTTASPIAIPLSGKMDLRAGEEIRIIPGFHVETGAEFHAEVNPFSCQNNQYKMKAAKGNTMPSAEKILIDSSRITRNENLLLYPNPSNGEIMIQTPTTYTGIVEVEILNTVGSLIHKESVQFLNGQIERFSLENKSIPKGLLLMQITAGAERFQGKLIFMP